MKKLLFIYHGGTIGQIPEIREGGRIILVVPADGSQFREVCLPIISQYDDFFETTFEVITTKDSTNLNQKDWEKLIFRIKKAQDDEGFDAVAIAHGTDTLPYTATALSLALHGRTPGRTGLRIPVCVTGAQNPIYDEKGDGRTNLARMLETLKQAIILGIADVMVNFDKRVLLGCRTLKVSERRYDAMQSLSSPDVGEIDSSGVHLNSSLLRKRADAEDKLLLAPKFGRGVVGIELVPGLEPSLILGFIANGGVAGMVLKSLGEGNVCCEGEFSLIPAIKRATEEYLTPIFITTKFAGGSSGACHYETGYEAIKAGGIACFDHTDVAVDVKVIWLIGNGICATVDDFKKAMATSFAGEVTPPTELV